MNNELLQLLNILKTAEGLSLGSIAQEMQGLKDDHENTKKDLEKVLLQIVDRVDSIPLNEEIGKLSDKLRSEISKLSDNFESKTEKQKTQIEKKIDTLASQMRKEIESKIPETIKETIIEKISEVSKELSPKEKLDLMKETLSVGNAELVVKMLESLEGENRLDKSAIKGLEQFIGQQDLDRAISILDQRTQFLINKINNLPTSTGGTGGSSVSVNGVEVTDPDFLDTDEIDVSASGSNVSIALKAGSIDETKLDASVNASLDKADSSIQTSEKGSANGVAELDAGGKVPSSQLPSYVDDVETYANFAALPVTGETGKIYITADTNLTYRWSGSAYVEISASLALGETSSTAYRGDRGKTAYDHSQSTGNPHSTAIGDISGLQTALDSKSSKEKTVNAQTGTTYTLAIADNDKFLTLANGSAIALTVPLNSSVAIPVGSRFEISQQGDGQVTFTPESGSVLLRSYGNAYKMAGKYAQAYLVKIATNEWSLDGNLTL